MTSRDFIRLNPTCAYCSTPDKPVRAIHRDHVVPIAMRRRHHIDADDITYWVAACGPCNWRKGNRKYFPRGFDKRILPGSGWQEWRGGAALEAKK
jgi:5-methylcytosine-specific restriction endonuclease McrA